MVEYRTVNIFICPYCDREYINEEDAQECANECADINSPIQDEKTNKNYCN